MLIHHNQLIDWSDERVAELRKLYAENLTAAEIARRIGGTRNAVLGKLHRLGITSGRKQRAAPAKPTSAARCRPSKPAAIAAPAPTPVLDVPAPLPAPIEPSLVPVGGVGFLDLRAGQCRFPLWPTGSHPPLEQLRFCGAPTLPEKSWCAACRAIVAPPSAQRFVA